MLSVDDIEKIALRTKVCSICGRELEWTYNNKQRASKPETPSLDRVKNEKILTIDNIAIICWQCNISKRNQSVKEFVDYCRKVVEKASEAERVAQVLTEAKADNISITYNTRRNLYVKTF